jgi:hypothetical protein
MDVIPDENAKCDHALIIATLREQTSEVYRLINTKIDLNAVDGRGITPLVYAIFAKNTEIIGMLLRGGANPNVPLNFMPLVIACDILNIEIIKLLVAAGASGDARVDDMLNISDPTDNIDSDNSAFRYNFADLTVAMDAIEMMSKSEKISKLQPKPPFKPPPKPSPKPQPKIITKPPIKPKPAPKPKPKPASKPVAKPIPKPVAKPIAKRK